MGIDAAVRGDKGSGLPTRATSACFWFHPFPLDKRHLLRLCDLTDHNGQPGCVVTDAQSPAFIRSETCPETCQELPQKRHNFAVDGMAFLQNPRGLSCFLIGNRHKVHTISFYATDTSNTEGLLGPWSRDRQLAPGPGAAAGPLPRESGRPQPAGTQAGAGFLGGDVLSPEEAAGAEQVLCSLLCDRGCKTLALTLQGISWTLRDFTDSSHISLSGEHVFSPGLQ